MIATIDNQLFSDKTMNHLIEMIKWSKEEILTNTTVKTFDTGKQAYIIDLPSWWIYYYPSDDYFMLVDCFGFKGFGKTLQDAQKSLDERLNNRIANCY
jgi:hypothetical protein